MRPRSTDLLVLAGLTFAAVAVHGYHPGAEDAEIYLPGVLKRLEPMLFPYNAEFFQSHASLTAFPDVMAASVRATRLPLAVVMLLWQLLSIFAVLLASRRIARLCFHSSAALWCSTALVASVLTIPVAGTSLYLIDPYVTSRSLSTPGALLAIASAAEGRAGRAAAWLLATAIVHPLMTVFAGSYLIVLAVLRRYDGGSAWTIAAVPFLLRPATPAYQRILETRPLHLITNWTWYEWLGVAAPLALLAWFARIGRTRRLGPMPWLCRGLIAFQLMFSLAAFVIAVPGRFEQLSELQPMRSLHLLYLLMFVFAGGLIGESLLGGRAWRWALLFVPLGAGMWTAQRQLFPASPHVEWPGRATSNSWVQAFEWIRDHTPADAFFALDPDHMAKDGEDEQGFRAIAQRSMLADAVKDSGAATMFPALADEWAEQVDAQAGWKHFGLADFERLKRRYGVNWVVVEQPGVEGLVCPYRNRRVLVCRLD
jgi:hypothetical protein